MRDLGHPDLWGANSLHPTLRDEAAKDGAPGVLWVGKENGSLFA
jgi:hypothetical protein